MVSPSISLEPISKPSPLIIPLSLSRERGMEK
jgi:hypothetical protein